MLVSVLKFGGSSLADPEKIKKVGQIVAKHSNNGPTVIVLSAMYGETNRLLNMAYALSPKPEPRELDLLMTTGEQVSVALLSIYLNNIGLQAISLNARQIKLSGIGPHHGAMVKSLDPSIITSYLEQGFVPIVTGFQVVLPCGNIASMERGGSDTTAVALAAAFDAKCYIYSDVDGVYSSDPCIVDDVQHIPMISHDDMLIFSAVGAKVLQVRSIELAKKYGVELFLRSTFSNVRETIVKNLGEEMSRFFGVAITKNRHLVQIYGQDRLLKLAKLEIVFENFTARENFDEAVVEPQFVPVLKAMFPDNINISDILSKVSLVGLGEQNKTKLLLNALDRLKQSNFHGLKFYNFNSNSIDFWVENSKTSEIANLLHAFVAESAVV